MVGPSNLVRMSCTVDQNVIGNAREALKARYGRRARLWKISEDGEIPNGRRN